MSEETTGSPPIIPIEEVQAPKMRSGGTSGTKDPRLTPRGDWGKMSPEKVMQNTRAMLHEQEHFDILIPSTERDKMPVVVGVNGYTYQIQRDKRVSVPLSVLKVLENAKMTTYTQRKRENGEGNELVPHEVLRFPFQRF